MNRLMSTAADIPAWERLSCEQQMFLRRSDEEMALLDLEGHLKINSVFKDGLNKLAKRRISSFEKLGRAKRKFRKSYAAEWGSVTNAKRLSAGGARHKNCSRYSSVDSTFLATSLGKIAGAYKSDLRSVVNYSAIQSAVGAGGAVATTEKATKDPEEEGKPNFQKTGKGGCAWCDGDHRFESDQCPKYNKDFLAAKKVSHMIRAAERSEAAGEYDDCMCAEVIEGKTGGRQ